MPAPKIIKSVYKDKPNVGHVKFEYNWDESNKTGFVWNTHLNKMVKTFGSKRELLAYTVSD